MNISDLTIEDLFETFSVAIILIIIVKIIYFVSLHFAVSNVRYEIENKGKMIKEQMEKQTELLERIAKALEQDQEPYIIESDKENK